MVYYILTTYICQFQNGKVHFCSSTGVQMSSQNIHSIFGLNLFEGLGVYCLMQHSLGLNWIWLGHKEISILVYPEPTGLQTKKPPECIVGILRDCSLCLECPGKPNIGCICVYCPGLCLQGEWWQRQGLHYLYSPFAVLMKSPCTYPQSLRSPPQYVEGYLVRVEISECPTPLLLHHKNYIFSRLLIGCQPND